MSIHQTNPDNRFHKLSNSPFRLENEAAYHQWRDEKLRDYPASTSEMTVSIGNPFSLTEAETGKLKAVLRKTNMVIYTTDTGDVADKRIPAAIGEQLGISRLDKNECADDDSFTSIQVNPEGLHNFYIPYTDKPLNWHTDGYYNSPERQIYSMTLHCVRPAESGGINQMMDYDMVYMRLRDSNPNLIRALMQPDAMLIPKNIIDGELVRPDRSGPVFSINDQGRLHMRYTARARNVVWKTDADTQAARQMITDILNDAEAVFSARLEAGQGLICSNVLHNRTAFTDHPDHPRLLYRGRYYDQLASS